MYIIFAHVYRSSLSLLLRILEFFISIQTIILLNSLNIIIQANEKKKSYNAQNPVTIIKSLPSHNNMNQHVLDTDKILDSFAKNY